MPRMPLNDECRRSLLRRLWVPVRPYFATASDAPHSYGYLDRSSARNRLRIISRVDRPLALCIRNSGDSSAERAERLRCPRQAPRYFRCSRDHVGAYRWVCESCIAHSDPN